MNTSSTTRFVRLVNFVEPYSKRPLENDVQALTRMLYARAKAGWEIVDMCRDEMRVPTLIYKRTESAARPTYLIEEIKLRESKDDIDSIICYLNERAKGNWLPSCILETGFYPPIAVMHWDSQISHITVQFKAHPLALQLFGRRTNYIANQLFDLQSNEHMHMACLIRDGLNPVLLMASGKPYEPFDYMVDHAFGGFYRNQTTTLSDLITARSEEGWHVCGAFQDVFQWPCVIFKRETISIPIRPTRSA